MVSYRNAGNFLSVVAIAATALQATPAHAGYVEVYQTWQVTTESTWEVKDLSGAPFNVPANAVAEVAVRSNTNTLRWGGVRAVGSSLERRFRLCGAADGWSVVVMHVQTDASSGIEHYSESQTELDFMLLGYWDSGTYVEAYNAFTAGANASWQDRNLSTYGVGAGEVAEVVVVHTDTTNEREAGARTDGSILQRVLDLTTPNIAGAVDPITMFVQAGATADATIEVYAQVNPQMDFYLVGYWTTNPSGSSTLRYLEKHSDIGSPSADATWEDNDLSSYGVPTAAVAELTPGNLHSSEANNLGTRENSSSLGRLFDLRAAAGGGGSYGRMHVAADSAATIEFYHEDVSDAHEFVLTGYWAVPAATIAESDGSTDVEEGCTTDTYTIVLDVPPTASVHITVDPDDQTDVGAGAGATIQLTFSTTNWDTPQTVTVTPVDDLVVEGSHTSTITHTATSSDSGYDGITIADVVANITTDNEPFTLTYVGALGTDTGLGYGINDNAYVAGYDEDPNDVESAWYWDGSSLTGLGTLGGSTSEALDINDLVEVVGLAETAGGDIRAFIWDSGSGMQDLGALSGRADSEAYAINENSEVAGTSLNLGTSPADWLAFFYLPAPAYSLPAGMNSLGTLGGNSSVARDVNDSGQVVGGAQNGSSNMRPFLWLPTAAYGLPAGMNDLGTLGGESPRIIHRAQAINNYGEVVGLSYTAAGDAHAFIWLPSAAYGLSAGMNDLGTLPGGDTSWAFGINDNGRVVGTSNVTGGDFHAFIWEDGTMYDVNDLLDPNDTWELQWVTDVNNDGEITGWGTNPSNDTRALLLSQPCGAKESMGSPPSDLVDEADKQAALELLTPAACGAGACGAGAVQCGLAGVGTLIGIRTRRRVRRRSEE